MSDLSWLFQVGVLPRGLRALGWVPKSGSFAGFAFGLIVGAALSAPAPASAQPPNLGMGGSQITEDALRRHVLALSSDEMEGRGNGTTGAERAAEYIASRFEALGLEPGAGDGYLHEYLVATGVRVQGVVGLMDLNRGFEFNKDYTPLGLSADGEAHGTLVFAGYGVTAPELGYDDYAGLDVRGKFVLAFLGEPGMRDPESPFDGESATVHSDLYRKAQVAREHGAAGLILTPGPLYSRRDDLDRVWKISQETGYRNAGILVCQMTNTAAQALVAPAKLDLRILQQRIDERHEPLSSDLPNEVDMRVRLRRLEARLGNVVAKLPGKSDRAVVLAADYDGYGMGPDNSNPELRPSANDNASGVAALLEIARVLEEMPTLEKTVYFVAFSGRRLTSVGSDAFVRDGVLEAGRIDAFLDMFALGTDNLDNLEIFGVSSGQGFRDLVSRVNREVRAPVALRTDGEAARAGDHVAFYRAGIPTLTAFGGAAPQIGTPDDTIEAINLASLARRTRFLCSLSLGLASKEGATEFRGR